MCGCGWWRNDTNAQPRNRARAEPQRQAMSKLTGMPGGMTILSPFLIARAARLDGGRARVRISPYRDTSACAKLVRILRSRPSMTFSSRHASLAVVALLGTVATLAANPRPAEACGPLTGERCGDLRAADGEGKPLPANATLVALESRMARDDSSLPRVEHSVSLTALDGIDPITERPLTFAAEDEAGVFLVRTGGLVVGERYEFRYDGYCAGDAATFSTVFVAEEQAPVPSEAGVLSVRETFEQPPSGNPCSADDTVSNAVVYFDLIANETFDRFRGVARLHTFVDGEPYSSTEYGGTRALGIRTRCVGGELSLGFSARKN